MQRLLLCMFFAAALFGVSASEVHAVPIEGVESSGDPPVPPPDGPAIERGECDVFINFDDVSAPCLFFDTGPLRDQYEDQGVLFSGPSALDGGAILNECGGFGVGGHSRPNFLAFNSGAQMGNGGIPRTPETMYFRELMSEVSILVGSGSDFSTVTLTAYDEFANVVDSESVNMTPNLQLLSVSGSGIIRVVLSGGSIVVVDDLCLVRDLPTPAIESTWGMIKSVYR